MIRRTAAITAVSIAGVIIAGGAAVGANVGILNASNDPTFGTLSADAAIFSADTTSSTSTTSLNGTGNQTSQVFSVDTAGTVTVETNGTGLRVADVVANAGWNWEETGHGSGATIVRFTSATETLEFHAKLHPDGSIEASVDRPGINTTTGSVTTSPGSYDDDHDDDHDEDHDEDHDKYEGRDDDD